MLGKRVSQVCAGTGRLHQRHAQEGVVMLKPLFEPAMGL